ncbi:MULTISPECIES: hypothetical protein [Oxalobacteraceae]|jgi:hypothetical protein|uniref:hypothetical protein n=1 Tax=Oxalobacteraceae TaxID=75682 RepID=UPI0010A2DD93|nr:MULTISPECIES: hypothetical protein [Oxalobacteraceae]HJV72885.1 hypothetical protein [Noviherbaspirillum sp.]
MPHSISVFRKEILPFIAMFAMLILAAIAGDALLHRFQLVWIGRYLGIPGTLLILASFGYSMRKRKMIKSGNPKKLLSLHEFMTWLGSVMILVHAGVHFNAILPWLAIVGMLVNVISGLTGKYLLDRSRRHMAAMKESLLQRGMHEDDVERELFWNAAAVDAMKKWRVLHIPITLAFAAFALGHIVSIFLFWNWK